MSTLAVSRLTRRFAGLTAVEDVSFDVRAGSITALIGPNGAGKTTVINMVSGVVKPSEGEIRFGTTHVSASPPAGVARAGIRRTFQTVHLFPGLTVAENLVVGRFSRLGEAGWWRCLLPPRLADRASQAEAAELLDRFGLAEQAGTIATELPYGTQRRVEIVRALVGRPQLLLLDEPAAGMNEQETERLGQDIASIRERGTTVLLVEHDMSLVMAVSDWIVVLNFGRKIAEGTPEAIRKDPAVIRSYLGE